MDSRTQLHCSNRSTLPRARGARAAHATHTPNDVRASPCPLRHMQRTIPARMPPTTHRPDHTHARRGFGRVSKRVVVQCRERGPGPKGKRRRKTRTRTATVCTNRPLSCFGLPALLSSDGNEVPAGSAARTNAPRRVLTPSPHIRRVCDTQQEKIGWAGRGGSGPSPPSVWHDTRHVHTARHLSDEPAPTHCRAFTRTHVCHHHPDRPADARDGTQAQSHSQVSLEALENPTACVTHPYYFVGCVGSG